MPIFTFTTSITKGRYDTEYDVEVTYSAERKGPVEIIDAKCPVHLTDEDFDLVIAVHLRGHFLLTRNAATYWRNQAKESGGSVYGRIINTSSEAGLSGPVGQANYGAAKAGKPATKQPAKPAK